MAFKFAWLVDLLESLDTARCQKLALSSCALKPGDIVDIWFAQHGDNIPRHGPSAVAFLSCIFPERLPNRTYGLREARLTNILGRLLCLGHTRTRQLRR